MWIQDLKQLQIRFHCCDSRSNSCFWWSSWRDLWNNMLVIVSVCVFCVKPLLLYDTWVVNGGGVVRRRMVLKCYTKNKLLYCVVHRQRSTITRCVLKTKIDRVSENRMFDYIKNTIQIYLDISCCLCYVVCFEQVNNYCFVVSILIYFHSVFFNDS